MWTFKNTTMFEYIWIAGHVALRLNHNTVVIGGVNYKMSDQLLITTDEIYMYNLYTEQWRKHQIQGNKPTPRYRACAAVIGTAIYIFGGRNNNTCECFNDLWQFTRIARGDFSWCKVEFECDAKLPSPRFDHSAWRYEDCMWVFGGKVDTEHRSEYLNYHGAFLDGTTNQLLHYNPSTQLWTNHNTSGAVPSPRGGHSTALIGDKVWLFAGASLSVFNPDTCFFELDMKSRTWTEIPTNNTMPIPHHGCSLITLSDSQLVVHIGTTDFPDHSDMWLIDVPTKTWRQYTPIKDQFRSGQTGTAGVNRCAIIFGGAFESDEEDKEHLGPSSPLLLHVMLEPNSLQQLAMKTIYNERDELPWMCLPPKLIEQLDLLQ